MAINAINKKEWFAYFPKDYRWSFITSIALMRTHTGAADTSEIFEICRRLEKKVGDDGQWFREWARMGERVRAMGLADERKGRRISAAGHHKRACTYFQNAERFRFPKDKKAKDIYRKSIDSFRRFVRLTDRPRTEVVEIPFEGGSLPAYFVHAENTRKAKPPVVVQYTGFDGTKEGSFGLAAEALIRRGKIGRAHV